MQFMKKGLFGKMQRMLLKSGLKNEKHFNVKLKQQVSVPRFLFISDLEKALSDTNRMLTLTSYLLYIFSE